MSASDGGRALEGGEALDGAAQARKEKRKALKKQKRKQIRRELAIREREEEEARANDPEEQLRLRLLEQEEAEATERERKAFVERERLWLEAAAARRAEEEQKEEEARRKRLLEESHEDEVKVEGELGEDDEWEYEEGPAEIIWKGNEIIVKKKQIRVRRRGVDNGLVEEVDDRPTSNPFPPQSVAFEAFNSLPPASAQEALENVAQQVPNFGTEQDKAHCPFHLKTGACRFGMRCSRVHFYPDKSCTLLIKNMYNGPGIAWEQDEGLEYTDEEVERCYEEFYEDVHTEFLKFGELVNFKVCRNSSFHLRGNVYIHYKNLESAILAYNTMNGRYYAGKQVNCEFVNITRWKIAICGEFMKSRLKTCSHGTACNFIHCFHNPGGDYEWADWDNPPPRYWVKKMAVLFGPSDGPRQDMHLEPESRQLPRELSKKRMQKSDRYHSRRDGHSERAPSSSSDGDVSDENRDRHRSRDRYSSHRRSSYSRDRRKATDLADKLEQSLGDHLPEVDQEYSRGGYDSSDGMLKAKERVSSHKERKDKERNFIDDHEERDRKRRSRSRNRLTGERAVDGLEKSERKSKHHGQRKRPDLLNSDSNHEVTDGNRKRSHLNDKASYKYVSDVDEQYSDRPSFVDLYSEKEFSHRRNMTSDFDRSNEGGESHRFPTSKHQSCYHKRDNETKPRKQEAKDKGLTPVESVDDWKKDVAESHKMHDKYVHGGRRGTRCRGELSLGRSEESSCEHKDGV